MVAREHVQTLKLNINKNAGAGMSNLKSAAPQTNDADYNNPNVKVSVNFISDHLHY
jgi:hypothetical protein